MTAPFPRDVVPFASSVGPRANLRALYSSQVWRNPEVAYGEYWSVDDPATTHRAGCGWGSPVSLRGVRVVFRPGYEPQRARLALLQEDGGATTVAEVAPAPREWTVRLDPAQLATGVVVEQPAGAGSATAARAGTSPGRA